MKSAISTAAVAMLLVVSGLAQSNIGGGRWQLTELNGKEISGSRAYIEFDETAKTFTGNAGCNRISGGYELTGQRFRAGRIGATRMACLGEGATRNEASFLEALRVADRLRRNGATLTLSTKGKRVMKFLRVGRFEREPVTMDLTAKKWMLRSVMGKRVDLRKDAPFLNFDGGKGSAGGNSGCNVFGGSYEATGSTIKFSDMISTMRACEFEDRMSIERGFFDALRHADRFEVRGSELLIKAGTKVLLEFEGGAK